jgi:hypothetical protein
MGVNIAKQLYALQGIDLDLEMKTEMLRGVESQLGDNRALAEVQAEVERKQKQLAELEKEQRMVEWETEDVQAKATQLEEKLYNISIRNPKELSSLEREIEHHRARIRGKEDSLLEIMSQVETIQQEIAAKEEVARQLEEEWRRRQKQLLAEQAELKAQLSRGERQRGEIVATIDLSSLQLYEALRIRKQGQAVAKVEQGRCQGCRIALPIDKLQQIRMEQLIQCGNCGRILYGG